MIIIYWFFREKFFFCNFSLFFTISVRSPERIAELTESSVNVLPAVVGSTAQFVELLQCGGAGRSTAAATFHHDGDDGQRQRKYLPGVFFLRAYIIILFALSAVYSFRIGFAAFMKLFVTKIFRAFHLDCDALQYNTSTYESNIGSSTLRAIHKMVSISNYAIPQSLLHVYIRSLVTRYTIMYRNTYWPVADISLVLLRTFPTTIFLAYDVFVLLLFSENSIYDTCITYSFFFFWLVLLFESKIDCNVYTAVTYIKIALSIWWASYLTNTSGHIYNITLCPHTI